MNLSFFTLYTALLRREIARFMSVMFQTLVTPLVTSSLYLLIFGVSLGKSIKLSNDLSYLGFIIPGLVMMGVLNNAYQNASSTIISSKFSGDLQDYKVTPLNFKHILSAISTAALLRGVLVGIITFLVGEVFYYFSHGELLTIKHPLLLMLFIFIGGISFALLGLSVAFKAKNMDQVSAVGSFVLVPLIYLGGVFFSLDQLHPVWQKISQFNPLLYFINGVRYGVYGFSDVSLTMALLVSFGSLAFFYGVALVCLKNGSFTRW